MIPNPWVTIWALISFGLAFGLMTIYASIFESYAHREGMHTPRFSRRAFRRHGQHHQDHLMIGLSEHPYDLRDSEVPWLWVLHIPLYVGLAVVWNVAAATGASFGAAMYVLAYEVMHYQMHSSKDNWFKRTEFFQARQRDHFHHHDRPQENFNVVLQFGDIVFRTYVNASVSQEKS